MTEPTKDIDVGVEVWAKREGTKTPSRAKVVSIINGINARVRDRSGHEWTVSISSLVPTVSSGEAGRSAVIAQKENIERGYQHLQNARRIAREGRE